MAEQSLSKKRKIAPVVKQEDCVEDQEDLSVPVALSDQLVECILTRINDDNNNSIELKTLTTQCDRFKNENDKLRKTVQMLTVLADTPKTKISALQTEINQLCRAKTNQNQALKNLENENEQLKLL